MDNQKLQQIEETKIQIADQPLQTTQQESFNIKKFLNNNIDFDFKNMSYHKIAIAPMLDITNLHFRFLMRLLTKQSTLYTEMIHCNAIVLNKNSKDDLLKYYPIEHPVVVQLGGSDPVQMAEAAKICQEVGYDEININCGCPSERVQKGSFGACLMKEPELVSQITSSIQKSVSIPCTVKCRLGVDDLDSYEFLRDFIKKVSEIGGVKKFILHARKAYLKGLNPAENRTVPPLKYDFVIKLKQDFPHLDISINGGFKTIEEIQKILEPSNNLQGCMIGRAAYSTPFMFSDFDRIFYNKPNPGYSRKEILSMWGDYGDSYLDQFPKCPYPNLTKPIINLFSNVPHSSKYRQLLSDRQSYVYTKSFKEFMENVITQMEEQNKEAINFKPPQLNSDKLIQDK